MTFFLSLNTMASASHELKRVTVTGAAGAIGYALLFRIASGQLFGPKTPVELRLLELPGKPVKALGSGVFMELTDCAFPLLKNVVCTSDTYEAFDGTDVALLVGARPRGKGMQRADLLRANAKIFKEQGTAIGRVASPNVRVTVVGNPANTNALITSRFACTGAGRADPRNITAMTRLDHNRGVAQLAQALRSSPECIERFCIWGNHSDTMWPDVSHAVLRKHLDDDNPQPISKLLSADWVRNTFVPVVKKRGSAVIAARGASSAASAANAAINHTHDWALGSDGRWTSMAVYSDGQYGAPKGVYCSFPVTCEPGFRYKVVPGLKMDEAAQKAFAKTTAELVAERDIAFKEVGI